MRQNNSKMFTTFLEAIKLVMVIPLEWMMVELGAPNIFLNKIQ